MKEKSEAEMLHRMAAYCSSAERCSQDIAKKLSASGLSEDAVDRIVRRLTDEKFLDNNRFSRSFVNDKLRFNKWGRVRISYELRGKGISQSAIDDALSTIDEKVYKEILLSLLKAKMKVTKGKDNHEINQKLLRFILGRGFTAKECYLALGQLENSSSLDYETIDDME